MTIEASLDRIACALEALIESQGLVSAAPEPQQQLDLAPAEKPKPKAKPKAEPKPEVVEDDDDLSDFDEDDVEDDLDDIDLDEEEEEAPPPPPKKKTKKKKTTKKTSKKAPVETKVGKESSSAFSEDDVRSKLKELQLACGDARLPKSILKRNGASTLGQLTAGKYANVISEIDAALAEYE